MAQAADLKRYRENLQNEIDSAALYRALAEIEAQPPLGQVYRRLAETEEGHAVFWEEKLRADGQAIPTRRPSWRSRTLSWLARR
jgi:rubrerythrin